MRAIVPREKRLPCVGDILRIGKFVSSESPEKRTYTAFCDDGAKDVVVCMVAGMKVRFFMPNKKEDLFKLFGEATILLVEDFSNIHNEIPPILAFDRGPIENIEESLARMPKNPKCVVMYVPHYEYKPA